MLASVFTLLALDAAVAVNMKHSFIPPYHANAAPFWKHGAGAYVNNTFVRLTPARQSRTGFFWNTIASKMTDWEVVFDFQIKGNRLLGGDGFAFWYTDTPEVLGMVYGAADYWRGLGIFFDTYDNNAAGQSPLITAVVNDGTMKYNAGTDGEDQASGKCSYQIRNLDKPSRCKIKYKDETLSVSIALDNEKELEPCFRVTDVKLGVDKYFGLSAHTGDVADSHDIMQFSVTDLSGTGADLDSLRDEYKKYVSEQQDTHEKISENDFRHTAMTLLHQIQDSLSYMEHIEEATNSLQMNLRKSNRHLTLTKDTILSEIVGLKKQIEEIGKSVELQSHHAPVDRDFMTRQIKNLQGEIMSLRTGAGNGKRDSLVPSSFGGPSDLVKQLNDIRDEQNQISMAVQRIERTLAATGGSSAWGATAGGYGRRGSGGTSWMTYLMYIVIVVVLGGGVYSAYQYNKSRQMRQYKLL